MHDNDDELVADYLERLGEPDDILRATDGLDEAGDSGARDLTAGLPVAGPTGRLAAGGPPVRPAGGDPAAGPPAAYPGGAGVVPGLARSGPGALEIIAVILLLVGGFLGGVGWIVGIVLLWASPRWRIPDKLLGTLVWPGGLAAAVIILHEGIRMTPGSPVVFVVGAAVAAAVQIAVVSWLLRVGRAAPPSRGSSAAPDAYGATPPATPVSPRARQTAPGSGAR